MRAAAEKADHDISHLARLEAAGDGAPQHRLDMGVGVVLRPSVAIDLFPGLSRHPRVAGADMLQIIVVHVWVHRNPFEIKGLVILGAGERRQQKNSRMSSGNSFLMMSMSRAMGSPACRWENREYSPRPGHHLGPPPGLQHDAVFPDLVLPLLGALKRFGIDVLEPDENLIAAGPRRLFDEVRNFVAQRVDLQDQLDLEALVLPQIDQAVEINSQFLFLAKLSSVTK